MISIARLIETIEAFDPRGDDRSARSRESTLALLLQGERALDRSNYLPGHITASAVVLSPDRSWILLVYHRKLGRWLQPGGHVEPDDATTMDAARREVIEETGVETIPGQPLVVGIDVHQIPAWMNEPAHLHHDIVWSFQARLSPVRSEGVQWSMVSGLDIPGIDLPLKRALGRALEAS